VETLGAKVYLRENTGRDFGSWQWGLREIPALTAADTLLLANDSVFGPLFDLGEVFAAMQAEGADVWGITDSLETRWHLQSYFLCLSRPAHQSPAFRRIFGQDFSSFDGRQRIIRLGEIQLSQELVAEGLIARAYCPYERISPAHNLGKWMNPMYYSWDALIVEQRCPYLKLELFRENSQGTRAAARWKTVIEGFTDYDSGLVEEYLERQPSAHALDVGDGVPR
jgi:lipopolysaccharide biosynthesis protein